MPRLIASIALCLLLAACATRAPAPLAELPALRLAPASLGQELALQQKLTFRRGGQQRELDALLEADGAEVRLLVQAMGQSGVKLSWDGAHLQQQRAPWLPPAVRGERVLDDLQFALWPLDAIRAALPAGWRVDEIDGERRLLDVQGRPWLLAQDAGGFGNVRLRNLAEGYELDVRSMPMEDASP
ncbi:MAG: DUF3261 domain-containing protein [Pseudoxanthomonas sp.]